MRTVDVLFTDHAAPAAAAAALGDLYQSAPSRVYQLMTPFAAGDML